MIKGIEVSSFPENVKVISQTSGILVLDVYKKKSNHEYYSSDPHARVRVVGKGGGRYDVLLNNGRTVGKNETPEFIAQWILRCAQEL